MLLLQTELSKNTFDHGENTKNAWCAHHIENIISLLTGSEKPFPCVFSRNACARELLCFLPIELNPSGNHNFSKLKKGIELYLKRCSKWAGDVNSAEPLLVIFESNNNKQYDKSAYEDIAFGAMQYLIDSDTQRWPDDLPTDPSDPFWSFCFQQTPLFINVSHPAHRLRKSRNLCDTLVLVINPRKRFDIVASAFEKKGINIRNKIRSNIDEYDKIQHSHLLGHYQIGESEWNQYSLPITNNEPPNKCPLVLPEKPSFDELPLDSGTCPHAAQTLKRENGRKAKTSENVGHEI